MNNPQRAKDEQTSNGAVGTDSVVSFQSLKIDSIQISQPSGHHMDLKQGGEGDTKNSMNAHML